MKSPIACYTTIAPLSVASGGAAPPNGDTHYPGRALRARSVDLGVIDSLFPAAIRQPQTGAGAVRGAALGEIPRSTRVTH